jgi:hypothetical protein
LNQKIQIVSSSLFVLLAILHIIWPNLRIDSITIVLLCLVVLPWIFPYIKAIELPGGFKIELRDIKWAIDKLALISKLESMTPQWS